MVSQSVKTDRELQISRLLNAPRDLVWEVFTQPQHISQWWGPEGFTNTIHTMDVKEGGIWDFVMHGPDGTDYPNKSRYLEVLKPEKLVLEHIVWPSFVLTVTLEPREEKTFLTWHMLFESAQVLEQVVKQHGAEEGMKQNIIKLEDYLKTAGKRSSASV
jgi:uncharacterized protein YndB with AHSA1/START domain